MQFVRNWLPVVICAALILIASDARFSAENSGHWLRLLLGEAAPEPVHFAIRKAAHLIEYGILAALAWRAHRRAFLPVLIALAVASVDELRQSLSPERTGTGWDVLLDCCGALLTIMLLEKRAMRRRPDTNPQATSNQ